MAYYKRIKELREDNDKTQNEIAKYLHNATSISDGMSRNPFS